MGFVESLHLEQESGAIPFKSAGKGLYATIFCFHALCCDMVEFRTDDGRGDSGKDTPEDSGKDSGGNSVIDRTLEKAEDRVAEKAVNSSIEAVFRQLK